MQSSLFLLTRALFALCIFGFTYFIWGCSPKVITEYYPVYKEVYIPMKCGIPPPIRPAYNNDIVIDNLNILQYTGALETALSLCIGNDKEGK